MNDTKINKELNHIVKDADNSTKECYKESEVKIEKVVEFGYDNKSHITFKPKSKRLKKCLSMPFTDLSVNKGPNEASQRICFKKGTIFKGKTTIKESSTKKNHILNIDNKNWKILYTTTYCGKYNVCIRSDPFRNLIEVKLIELKEISRPKTIFEMTQQINKTPLNVHKIWNDVVKNSSKDITSDCIKFFEKIKNNYENQYNKQTLFKRSRNAIISNEIQTVGFEDIMPLVNKLMNPNRKLINKHHHKKIRVGSLEKIPELSSIKEEDTSAFFQYEDDIKAINEDIIPLADRINKNLFNKVCKKFKQTYD